MGLVRGSPVVESGRVAKDIHIPCHLGGAQQLADGGGVLLQTLCVMDCKVLSFGTAEYHEEGGKDVFSSSPGVVVEFAAKLLSTEAQGGVEVSLVGEPVEVGEDHYHPQR